MAIPPTTNAPPPPAPPVAPPSQPLNSGTILQLPPSLSTASVGQVVEGVVAERLAGAQFRIVTTAGALTLRTSLPLPLNTAVTLQLTTGGPQPNVTVTPQIPPAPPLPTAATATAANLVGTVVAATVGPGAVTASVVPPPANAANPVANFTPGASLSVRILAVSPPGTPVTAATAPTGTPAGTPSSATGPTLTATVTGANAAGQTVVQAGGVELTLATARPLPVGGNLLLGVLPLPPPGGGLDPQSLALAPRWEALSDALRLGGFSPLRAALTASIPQPGTQLAGTLLFFLAALRGGDLRGWLGQDAARLLQGGGLDRIGDEFAVMQRLATEPAGQDWRLFLVPFLSDDQLHQLRFFVRDDPGKSDDSAAAGIRFIIEVTFTKLGPFQFDGLVRDKSMDLIIRTELALPETARRDIQRIYGDTLAALGYTGGVDIRTESFFEVQPLQEAGLPSNQGVIA